MNNSFAKIYSAAICGIDALSIDIEVDVTQSEENRTVVIVGLPDMAVRESKDRIFAAIRNSGFSVRHRVHCTINLAPSNLKKEGSLYDLPIAIALLKSFGVITKAVLDDFLIVGELGLSGETRPIRGALATAILAKKSGKKGIILPKSNAKEAAAIPGLKIIPVENLAEVVSFLENPEMFQKEDLPLQKLKPYLPLIDFADIKGQAHVKRAMEILAAGEHNAILCGPPGAGKSMIAKALPGILPEMSIAEALEATKIHSIVGILPEGESLIAKRPFRSPHHTISYAGLVGGGTNPRPGEISLAHNGILFLDELPEFPRSILEALRQPLEDRYISISRANGNFKFPTSFICIATMNPCPCGFLSHPDKECKDTQAQIDRYQGKISGPLLDRIDMHIDVPPIRYDELSSKKIEENSEAIRERVKNARLKQTRRFGRIKTNAQMTPREIKEYCFLDSECHDTMREAFEEMDISARAGGRILRIARTIADLEGRSNINRDHLMEAINFRIRK